MPPNNLSTELSSLIGRESELEAIGGLLEQGNVRLVTITGAGGSGKTRLAQAIAHKSLAKFADGVYFIDLSAIASAELIVPIVAQTLTVREENGKPLKECLHEHLQRKHVLLVLDNFEQITEAAAEIAEFLSVSLELKLLVTSRIRLNLRPEHEFPLAPLAVPVDECRLAKELHQYPAVKLFVERARALKPSFDLTDENAASVAQICRRLDGLPLAIELAAVRIKLFAPQAILTRLSNSLNLLTGGSRDLPERQQTMRGTIGWSYDLLPGEEKRLLNRLAVFAGGFTLDGAEAIVEAGEVLRVDLLNSVASLVDKSLLSQRELPDGEPRFRMLQVVREFALDTLGASSEADKINSAHAEFYAALAEKAQSELSGPSGAQWYEILEREHDNLRSALDWTLTHQPQVSLRLVSALGGFWVRHGYLAEGLKWSKQALEQSRGDDQVLKLQAKTCCNIGSLSWHQGDLVTAELFNHEGLKLSRLVGAKEIICAALNGLGIVKLQRDELTEGRLLLEESLSVAREINDRFQIPRRLNNLGEIARMEKDFEAARRYYEEAYAIAKQESPSDVSVFSCNLGAISVLLGDYEAARSYSLIALEVSQAMGHKRAIGFALDNFAALATENGASEKAARLWGAAQSIKEAIGYRLEGVDKEFNDHYMGEARSAIGDEAFAASFEAGRLMPLQNALTLARETDFPGF